MHVHSAWYVFDGVAPEQVVFNGAPPALPGGDPTWMRVDSGYASLGRGWMAYEGLEAAWLSPRSDFTVAAYVLDDPGLSERMAGAVVGVAGPVAAANLSVAARWRPTAGHEIRTDFHQAYHADGVVLALRFQDPLGTHVVDLADPRPLYDAFGIPEARAVNGLTVRLADGIVNLFDDNQIFLTDVAPSAVPRIVTVVGTAFWEPRL
ncbi:hypothetical protein [Phytohabitans rumicis]|nr:hypothetical protein [Phytohabitans rumicis]